MNWYCEPLESKYAPTDMLLLPTPGFSAFATTTDVGDRGALVINGRAFRVIGTGFWELFENASPIKWGSVAQDSNLATISANGAGQLLVTSGRNAYLFDLTTNTLTEVLSNVATMAGAQSGYFLVLDSTTGIIRLSDLNDGSTYSQAFTWESPDPLKAMIVSDPEVFLIGENTGAAWFNSGAFPQPFAPIPGAAWRWGTTNPFSVSLANGTLVWLSNTTSGATQIVAAKGYTPEPISTFAVETALARYSRAGQIRGDVETLVYQERGHLFACFSFPSAGATWVIDLTTGLWHERGAWNSAQHRYDVWAPRVHSQAFGRHLVGNRASGVIYAMDADEGLEADGAPIRRLRIGPPILAPQNGRVQISRFDLHLDTGVGVANGQGSDPKVFLRESVDSRTWGPSRARSTGKVGDYGRRVFWTRCRSSLKVWMPEITVSDPVPWRIAGASIDGYGFSSAAA